MLNDFDVITHSFPGEINIYAVADVHLGAIEHNEQAWIAFLNRVKTENAKIILVGDLLNNGVRTCKFANPFDEVLRPREAKARMVEYLEPLAKNLLCSVSGNHERRTEITTDNDLSYDIMAKLDKEHIYRQNFAMLLIGTGKRPKADRPECCYSMVVTHGAGGGTLTGSATNRAEDFGRTFDGLDALILGHTHKGFITHPSKIVIDARNQRVSMKHFCVVSCESWLDYGGYAARAMLRPAETCRPQKLHLSADHHNKKITATW